MNKTYKYFARQDLYFIHYTLTKCHIEYKFLVQYIYLKDIIFISIYYLLI